MSDEQFKDAIRAAIKLMDEMPVADMFNMDEVRKHMSFTPVETYRIGDQVIWITAPRTDIISRLLRALRIADRTAPKAYRCHA